MGMTADREALKREAVAVVDHRSLPTAALARGVLSLLAELEAAESQKGKWETATHAATESTANLGRKATELATERDQLREDIRQYQAGGEEVAKTLRDNQRLREALEFYAHAGHYRRVLFDDDTVDSRINRDGGNRAFRALADDET